MLLHGNLVEVLVKFTPKVFGKVPYFGKATKFERSVFLSLFRCVFAFSELP
jgi:hypothetical protein